MGTRVDLGEILRLLNDDRNTKYSFRVIKILQCSKALLRRYTVLNTEFLIKRTGTKDKVATLMENWTSPNKGLSKQELRICVIFVLGKQKRSINRAVNSIDFLEMTK